MTLASNSGGAGHTYGGFGHGRYGHGAWLTFPFTPGYSFTTEDEYAVTPNRFESQDAQWYRTSRDRGRSLTYEMPFPSSSTVCDMTNWFLAAGGPATRFVAMDHESQTRQVVRFTTPDFSVNRQNGMQFDIPPFNLKGEKRISYAEEVIIDSPSFWWRLNDSIGVTSVFDNGVGFVSATSRHGLVVRGGSFGLIGLLADDRATGVICTSLQITLPTSYKLTDFMALSVVVQPAWPPRTRAIQEIYAAYGTGGQTQFCIRIDSGGFPQFVASRSVVLTSPVALIDNMPHHIGILALPFGGAEAYVLYIDGSLQITGVGAGTSGTVVVSASIGYASTSLQYFDGVIQDMTVFCSSFDAQARFAVYARVVDGL